MKKILLTGFEPFGGERINPAVEAMNRLKGRTLGQHVIVGLELPTVFGKSTDTLIAAMEEMGPDIVIGLGQGGGRAEITFERIAINMDDAAIPDNDGNQPLDWPIVAEGPTAYWSTLPVKAMTDQLRARGIPASVSNTAGTFVCNHLFYGLMHHIAVSGRRSGAASSMFLICRNRRCGIPGPQAWRWIKSFWAWSWRSAS
ncbi:hypothetical protein HMSSN036_89080 [Paenibacillus macerans]|nr:hypothetical protein HMSSN036_89080 [Paenibacillus macerans]